MACYGDSIALVWPDALNPHRELLFLGQGLVLGLSFELGWDWG